MLLPLLLLLPRLPLMRMLLLKLQRSMPRLLQCLQIQHWSTPPTLKN